jgi:hypothetical protein
MYNFEGVGGLWTRADSQSLAIDELKELWWI